MQNCKKFYSFSHPFQHYESFKSKVDLQKSQNKNGEFFLNNLQASHVLALNSFHCFQAHPINKNFKRGNICYKQKVTIELIYYLPVSQNKGNDSFISLKWASAGECGEQTLCSLLCGLIMESFQILIYHSNFKRNCQPGQGPL